MSGNEKLIEEAAKAISPWAWGSSLKMNTAQAEARRDAAAALAVFEKAHTPTDDEISIAAQIHTRYLHGEFDGEGHKPGDSMRLAVLEGVRAGFRRSEVPEPSAESYLTDADLDRFEAVAQTIYRSTREAAQASKFLVSDFGQWIVRLVAEVRRLRTAEAEDERIDAWHYVADHEAFKACYDEEQPLIDSVLARITYLHEMESTVNELAPAPEPQGEPSDAQVLAALNAYNDDTDAELRDWSPYKVNAMRDALRAVAQA